VNNIIYINSSEFILLGLSLIFILINAFNLTKSIAKSILLTLLLIPPLYLSVEGTTQFLTADEPGMLINVINIQDSSYIEQWYHKANNRTSEAFIGTLLNLIQEYIPIELNQKELKIFAKSFHWFLGFTIIIIIYSLIKTYFIPEKQAIFYFIIYFYSIFLLPVSVLALKVFNYDLFSMLLGTLTIILLLIAIKEQDSKYAFIGIITGMLAAQEKLIASPVLLGVIIVFAYIRINQSLWKNFIICLFFVSYAIYIAFLTSLTTFSFIAIMVDGFIPKINYISLIKPLFTFLAPIVRVFEGAFKVPANSLIIVTVTASLIVFLLVKYQIIIIRHVFPFIRKNLFFFVILPFFVGFFGTYLLMDSVFVHPSYPVPEQNYFPPYSMNKATPHFGAETVVEHTLAYIGVAYAGFVQAIPTVFFIILFLSFWWFIHDNIGWRIILLLAFLMPLIYAITFTPVSFRYFNLFIFLVVIAATLEFIKILSHFNIKQQWILTYLFIFTLTIEVLPFRPIFAPFRPIWSHPSTHYNEIPFFGRGSLWWPGWGEERFLVKKRIEKVLDEGENIQYLKYNKQFNGINILNRADFAYYKIRSKKARELMRKYINKKPLFTLSYRGYIQAWIYQKE